MGRTDSVIGYKSRSSARFFNFFDTWRNVHLGHTEKLDSDDNRLSTGDKLFDSGFCWRGPDRAKWSTGNVQYREADCEKDDKAETHKKTCRHVCNHSTVRCYSIPWQVVLHSATRQGTHSKWDRENWAVPRASMKVWNDNFNFELIEFLNFIGLSDNTSNCVHLHCEATTCTAPWNITLLHDSIICLLQPVKYLDDQLLWWVGRRKVSVRLYADLGGNWSSSLDNMLYGFGVVLCK